MADPGHPHTPPSAGDGDGVRAIPKPRTARRSVLSWVVAFAVVAGVGFAVWSIAPQPVDVPAAGVAGGATPAFAPAAGSVAPARPITVTSMAAMQSNLPNDDPNDLANYFRPGDPEPTGAELIDALHDVGIRTGIGAFNPPGTSPPLEGLAVPGDFVLPEGYVRHHQSTDDGASIEAILMFAPDFILLGPDGRPIALPEDRVVPPGLAPPGLPLRRVRIPPG